MKESSINVCFIVDAVSLPYHITDFPTFFDLQESRLVGKTSWRWSRWTRKTLQVPGLLAIFFSLIPAKSEVVLISSSEWLLISALVKRLFMYCIQFVGAHRIIILVFFVIQRNYFLLCFSSSAADTAFDAVIGMIEDIIMSMFFFCFFFIA